VLIDPNNDPGWRGILREYDRLKKGPAIERYQNLSRDAFLRWVRSSQLLVGNSSSGIIEAASLGTRVVNVGSRQQGRERSANVVDVPWDESAIVAAIRANFGKPYRGKNVYGGGGAGKKIAAALSAVRMDDTLRRKLIRY
jgi:GDP/UDP-N,N'-diacetylbacillosamine 2-epimerase (hydrolysing)